MTSGPLNGIRIIELAGLGPAPFAAMLLSDMGAEVIRIDRLDRVGSDIESAPLDVTGRGRRSVAIDLKHPDGIEALLQLVSSADGLIEGFRPGVTERLGCGPDVCLARRPSIVYGRMTGWGQDGPLAAAAGHDINYISLAGALYPIGARGGPPTPPLNLIGDYGGGGMLLAFGVVCALLEARSSGRGQVIDAAMVDGAALLTAVFYGLVADGSWKDERGSNLIDGGAHMYGVYETADHEYISIGALEPQFYAQLLAIIGLSEDKAPRMDRDQWPQLRTKMAEIFRTKTRDQWSELLEGTDACFAPVLSFHEATLHPHNRERQTFVDIDGLSQPAPAPRFSRTPAKIAGPPHRAGQDTESVFADWGFDNAEIQRLKDAGAVA